ncbi:MAG TPA: heme biosynthesis HemY N-terminal domain-containing protein [Macromonas sp.]|nr:heme biosynthesis HemY N-terminal domain-containing protein [Macromonas sp.]
MKSVFWFLFIAALAVALALLVGGNTASVALFWAPYRVDMSFNLVMFGLLLAFVLLYLTLRGWALLWRLPEQAHRWRMQQLERAIHVSVLDALAYQISGRYVRAQSAAERALEQLAGLKADEFPHHAQVSVLARWLAAESAKALGNTARRDSHLQEAVEGPTARAAGPAREGALLRAATWALEMHDTSTAERWLGELPQGALRRIQALRLRLRLAQLQRNTHAALDMVRLLTKHRAFTPRVAASVLRALILEALRETHDSGQLFKVWQSLDASERDTPELALALLDRWHALRNALPDAEADTPALRRVLEQCLQTAWSAYDQLALDARRRLILRLEAQLPQLDGGWLAQIERRQQAHPADAGLQYLAGQAFMQRQLWGKAALLLGQASHGVQDPELARRTWCSLARLAEERGDTAAAQAAWKKAAHIF